MVVKSNSRKGVRAPVSPVSPLSPLSPDPFEPPESEPEPPDPAVPMMPPPLRPAASRAMRRRPPCRDSGADPRSRGLAERMAVHGRAISARQRVLLADIAEFDRTESWRGDGAVSMVAWLTERCGVSGSTASVWVRTAAKLESLPRLGDSLANGTLSLDAVALLAEVATPQTDADLADAAVHWTVKQVRELVASHRGATDAAAARRFENRSLRFNDSKGTIWAALTSDDYAVAKSALISRISWGGVVGAASGNGSSAEGASSGGTGASAGGTGASAGATGASAGGTGASAGATGASAGATGASAGGASGASGTADPLGYTPFDQRLYDAFMDLCRGASRGASRPASRSASGPGRGSDGDVPGNEGGSADNPGGFKGFRPTVVVHTDLGFLTGLDPNGGADLAGVGPISQEVARRLACDSKVVFSVEHGVGCILDQKRVRRSPTTAQRIEIARRDKGCRFASCGFTDFTEVHHMVPWVLGGETNLSNLITLCGRHHRAVHELGWSMQGSADGVVTFEGPNGHRMTSAPSPTWRRMGSMPQRR
jgi:hypothetical protein